MVVRPADTEQLRRAVALISEAGLAMAPRGGGFTYVRGYTPRQPGFVAIDLRRMNRILEISERDMYITVEAGVTWKQIYDALKPRGLRLPFFGTFSGRGATVGGGLANGALFFGTARHGSAAEIVLGLQVVLSDGTLLHTGQTAVAKATKPFFRTFGPDMTGIFVHDAGAFGVKATATLRLMRMPAETDYLSFGFKDRGSAIETLSEIGRSELAEDAYVMDPDKTRAALASPTDLVRDAKTLAKVVRQEGTLLRGLKAGAQLALAGRNFIEEGCYSLHLVCAARTRAGLDADMSEARAIAARLGGQELPNSIPKAARADLFPPLDVVGPTADRWVALNAKVAHSDAPALVQSVEELITSYRSRLDASGVVLSRLLTVIGTHAFSYEPVFNWHDSWLPMHRATLRQQDMLGRFEEPPANLEARQLVMEVRQKIVDLFADHAAASNQIGRTYPYADILKPESRQLLEGIKHLVDPKRLMNPGALGLD